MKEGQNTPASVAVPKYRQILNEIRRSISVGQYKTGDRLPSETELGAQFGVSRLTIQRVLKELQIEGLVDRRAGSGTYVKPRANAEGHLFGLLIPGLGETEIFEPICQGMARAGRQGGHALLWGDTSQGGAGQEREALQLCSDYIARRVSGVFFAPIEGIAGKDDVNREVIRLLNDANIPIVLLDRCIEDYPNRSRFDLVGIDNRRAGNLVTRHLLQHSVKSPVFLAREFTAPTVDARIRGFFDALHQHPAGPGYVIRCNPDNPAAIAEAMARLRPDAFVCANDVTAANLMHSLEELGHDVPGDIRLVGIDDVRYAKLLRVPLTTLRQPCQEMGEMAIQVMLSRIAQPGLPARDILLDCRLVVRQSCGDGHRS